MTGSSPMSVMEAPDLSPPPLKKQRTAEELHPKPLDPDEMPIDDPDDFYDDPPESGKHGKAHQENPTGSLSGLGLDGTSQSSEKLEGPSFELDAISQKKNMTKEDQPDTRRVNRTDDPSSSTSNVTNLALVTFNNHIPIENSQGSSVPSGFEANAMSTSNGLLSANGPTLLSRTESHIIASVAAEHSMDIDEAVAPSTSAKSTEKSAGSENKGQQVSEDVTQHPADGAPEVLQPANTFPNPIAHLHDTLLEPTNSNNDHEAEWEIDSSPYESDSDSDSSSSSSDSDDDSDSDEAEPYTLLSPAEQARILMEAEGGSDDEGNSKSTKPGAGSHIRTVNEKPEEVIPKPDIVVTPDMKISELGSVEHIVENTVVIKAKTSGEYQVLEMNSLLCLSDRSVIGVVAETLGQVQQPFYCVRFTNSDSISEAGVKEGSDIFYVDQHSTFVFTQPLKAVKGSDASNLYDEEVAESEAEYSDDEEEAEHKRKLKLERQAKRAERNGGMRGRGGHNKSNHNPMPIVSELSYDDNQDPEQYTRLSRPTNLHELMGGKEAPIERLVHDSNSSGGNNRGGRGMGRNRGDRGRGRGDRGGRGGGRGSRFNNGRDRDDGRKNYNDRSGGQSQGQAGGNFNTSYSLPPSESQFPATSATTNAFQQQSYLPSHPLPQQQNFSQLPFYSPQPPSSFIPPTTPYYWPQQQPQQPPSQGQTPQQQVQAALYLLQQYGAQAQGRGPQGPPGQGGQ
ncbi:MAG: hypothetical protein M1834_007143 [Cirrosporium novae-zelandiae]|nr:MAG: hypothetical protein M1834_007143 [Cirrosporium novae-zelandiae]